MTKPEIRKEWTKRLRSGNIKQNRGALGDLIGQRCCLGVLCDIAVEQNIIPKPTSIHHLLNYSGNTIRLPDAVIKWSGLRNNWGAFRVDESVPDSLANLNDLGQSFIDIARLIETEPSLYEKGAIND